MRQRETLPRHGSLERQSGDCKLQPLSWGLADSLVILGIHFRCGERLLPAIEMPTDDLAFSAFGMLASRRRLVNRQQPLAAELIALVDRNLMTALLASAIRSCQRQIALQVRRDAAKNVDLVTGVKEKLHHCCAVATTTPCRPVLRRAGDGSSVTGKAAESRLKILEELPPVLFVEVQHSAIATLWRAATATLRPDYRRSRNGRRID